MAAGLDFSGMVPGLDFLQGLMKGAGAAMPGVGQWVAPTLDPEELDKRISELRTVQFWLEQNAKLLATTIQALEVQRMTLTTLQTMNLPLAELRDALTLKPPAAPEPTPAQAFAASFPPRPAPQVTPAAVAPSPEAAAAPAPPAPEPAPPEAAKAAAQPAAAVDPMQWWGALTQQFSEIASQALQAGALQQAGAQAASGAQAAPGPRKAAAKPAARPAAKSKTPARPAAKKAAARPAQAGAAAKRAGTARKARTGG